MQCRLGRLPFPSDRVKPISGMHPNAATKRWDDNHCHHCRIPWHPSSPYLELRTGRDQPRHSVERQPPGASRRDLIPTQPIDLIVRAKRRALPVVMGKSSKARRATVLVHVRLLGSARSSARLQGSFSPSDSSAFIRCNRPKNDISAPCGRV